MIDTHAHYDDARYETDIDDVLKAAKEAGVTKIINATTDAASLARVLALTARFDMIYTAVGLHPENAADLLCGEDGTNDDVMPDGSAAADSPALQQHLEAFRTAAAENEKVVAIGEIGLDYHYETPAPDAPDDVQRLAASWEYGEEPVSWPPRSIQQEVFCRQIDLAKELRLPVVIHSRDAYEDTLRILKEKDAGENGCDMHCYGYSKESAREFLDLGCYLGIGGVSTFKNGRKLKEVIAYAPLDRLLLETDAPYLAPEPYRGKRNQSAYLVQVVKAIAEIKGVGEEEVVRQTTENAEKLFARLGRNTSPAPCGAPSPQGEGLKM